MRKSKVSQHIARHSLVREVDEPTLEHVVGYRAVSSAGLHDQILAHSHSAVFAVTPCKGSLIPNFFLLAISLGNNEASLAGGMSAAKRNSLIQ